MQANINDYIRLVTSSHKNQPKFIETIKVSINPLVDSINFLRELNGFFNIETAIGKQLDIIGAWVGMPRIVPDVMHLPLFGFISQPQALPFGDPPNSEIGGYWRESGMSGKLGYRLDDDLYRKAIIAKIYRNKCSCLMSDAHNIVSTLTNVQFEIIDHLNMTISLNFLEEIDSVTLEIIRFLFPKPMGINLIVNEV